MSTVWRERANPPEAAARQARVDLAAAHRLAVMDDLHEGTWNHFSAKVPGDPERILLTPSNTHWSQVTAGSLVEVGPEDRDSLRRGGGMPWTAYRIHAPIHAARPDIACVLHAHPPYALAISMLEGGRLEFAEQNALYFYGRIAYNDVYDGESRLDASQGEAMAQALPPGVRVLVLKSHGVVVVGATIGAAYTDLYRLERACRAQILAMSTGRPLQRVSADAAERIAALNDESKHEHFDAMKRLLDEREPDYAS